MTRITDRAYLGVSGLLLLVGSYLSQNGGRKHPIISPAMGEYGTPAFFQAFARVITTDPAWGPVHAQILAAPLLWCLGGAAVSVLVRGTWGAPWSRLGLLSISMGAVLWTLTYIFDGFVADRLAPLVLGGEPSVLRPAYTATFGANQWVAIRASFPAWLLISIGTTSLTIAVASLIRSNRGLMRWAAALLTVLGALVGGWTLVVSAAGGFEPGPMVSPMYLPALIGTQWWYLVLGLVLVWLAVQRQPVVGPPPTAKEHDDRPFVTA